MYYLKPTQIIFLVFTLLTFFYANTVLAEGDEYGHTIPLDQQYSEAKFYYKQLQSNEHIATSRENWLKGTRNFRRIYIAAPQSQYGPACLFMLGRMHLEMFARFEAQKDLDDSISYFKQTYKQFPDDRLADDAMYSIGKLYLIQQNDPDTASKWFNLVINEFPNGDMHGHAQEKLKRLSKDHDIPLPEDMVGGSQLGKLNYVLPVKYWSSENYSRVVIGASGPLEYSETLLEKTGNRPRRLYIDLKNSYIEPQYREPIPVDDGLLQQVRTGQNTTDTVRVVLDIESISNYKIFSLPEPFRVVIDVRGDKKSTELTKKVTPIAQPVIVPDQLEQTKNQTAETPKPVKSVEPEIAIKESEQTEEKSSEIILLDDNKKFKINNGIIYFSKSFKKQYPEIDRLAPTITLAQQLGLGIQSIIIDPGHGGKDPGAMAYGLKEKDLVLHIAKKLAPVLEHKIGCEVSLTRDSDIFIPLEERTAIANTSGADLFISLHINAHSSRDIRGLETYYLDLSTNAEAMRVAARENSTSTHQMSDLQDILSEIMSNSKMDESSRLAEYVHASILNGMKGKEYHSIKNLGVKQAPFYVLIGAEMPAILIEIAFISNKADADNLINDKFIDEIASQITQGVINYVNTITASL